MRGVSFGPFLGVLATIGMANTAAWAFRRVRNPYWFSGDRLRPISTISPTMTQRSDPYIESDVHRLLNLPSWPPTVVAPKWTFMTNSVPGQR